MQASERLYTFEEYIEYYDKTDNQHELVDGKLVKIPPPSGKHVKIARSLLMQFGKEIERLGTPWIIGCGDIGVRTAVRYCRIPDLAVISLEQEQELESAAVVQTPPLLIVEIASKHNSSTDYRYKRSEYAVCRIPEYWIVDPSQSKVTVLSLFEGFYEEQIYVGNERIISLAFPQLLLTVMQVLEA